MCMYVIATYLRIEDIGEDWLIEVVLVSTLMELNNSVLEHLIDGGLPSTSGTHTHESVTHQHCLVQLDNLLYLYKRKSILTCSSLRINTTVSFPIHSTNHIIAIPK